MTVSELASAYQNHDGSQYVLDAIDSINIHMLPFFSTKASTGKKAWPLVEDTLHFFIKNGAGKKMYLDEVRTASFESLTGRTPLLVSRSSGRMGGPL